MSIQSLTVRAHVYPFLTLFVGDPDSYGQTNPDHGFPSFLACLNHLVVSYAFTSPCSMCALHFSLRRNSADSLTAVLLAFGCMLGGKCTFTTANEFAVDRLTVNPFSVHSEIPMV